jgi:threonine/homoserine/homoserine lactone efflux protein
MVYASMAFVLFGCLVLLKALTNPRLRELRVVDAIQLVAVGMFVGVGIGLFSRFVQND